MVTAFIKERKKAAWLCFFVLVYVGVLVWKFWPLISINQILPGNDTLGHFWAFHELFQSLAAGHFWNYSVYWFGGMPLFQFYAPLGFLLMSGLYAALGWFASQYLVFRWVVFLAFAVFPLPFYFFVKNYAGRRAAYFSLPLGLLLIFYPPFLNFLGLGAASAINAGLFDQMIAVDILLFYLVALKKLVDADGWDWKWVFWGAVSLALVFLAHTLTSIMAGVLTLIIGLFYVRRWFKQGLFWNFAATITLGFLLSAFWLLPFVLNLKFTSAEAISVSSFLASPLYVFAPFHLNDIWSGGGAIFPYVWFAVWAAFIAGTVRTLREKKSLLVVVLAFIFLAFGLDYFDAVFPGLTLHYYRLLSYGLIFFLAIAAAGAAWVWEHWNGRRTFLVLGSVIGGLLIFQSIYTFNLSGALSTLQPSGGTVSVANQLTGIQYHWDISQYPAFGYANQVLTDLRTPPSTGKPQRILPDMAPVVMMDALGSVHFFNATLPLVNDQSSLFGLYAESAWQLPFIFPTTNLVTGNGMLWGRVRDLAFDDYFQGQSLEDMAKRLQLFGINYLVTGSTFFDANVQKIKEATLVKNDGAFKIYHLSGAKPMVYPAGHAPGLFVRYGGLDFREFALGWYSVPNLLDYPVADWMSAPDALTKKAADRFSFIAVELDGQPSATFVRQVTSLGKPIIFLNEQSGSLGLSDGRNIWEVDSFEPVALFGKQLPEMTQPNVPGLTMLSSFVREFAPPNPAATTTPDIYDLSGERVAWNGAGPDIVDLGYFPYWQCSAGCDNVYPVTPGQMLIFSNGDTVLTYQPGRDTQVGLGLSVLGLFSALAVAYGAWRKRRRILV